MYMHQLQPQQQSYLPEDSRRIIDKVQTLRSSNQHFKSTSDVKYSNNLDTQNQLSKMKVVENSANTTSNTLNQKQSNQPKSNISNQPYQMNGVPATQRNYLQVGKIDLESIMGQNKKVPPTNYMPHLYVNQAPVTQRDANKRSTLPPDRRSFQDQFTTTPVNISSSNIGQQQPVATSKIQLNQTNNVRTIQSQTNFHRSNSNGMANTSLNGQIQPQQQQQVAQPTTASNTNIVPQTQQQFEDLEKYRKQMQQKGVTPVPATKQQLLQQYQNSLSQNSSAVYNRQGHNSEINILYYTGNVSSNDLNQNQQNRMPSDTQLHLPPSPTKLQSQLLKNGETSNQMQQKQQQNLINPQKINVPEYNYVTNTSRNIGNVPENQTSIGVSPFISPRPLASANLIPVDQKKQQNPNNQNYLSVKNIAFQYVDQNQIQNKPSSHSPSIHQNVPQSPQSAGFIGLNKSSLSNLVHSQQMSHITSLNPSVQNSMVNQPATQHISNQSPEKPSQVNTNTFNSKTQSIDDILKTLRNKDPIKGQSIPQKIFSSTLQAGQFKQATQAANNYEVSGNYQLNGKSAGREANIEKKSDIPLSNPTQIGSLNTYQIEKRPGMRHNSDKISFTNRNINDYSNGSINLYNNISTNYNNNTDYFSMKANTRHLNESNINTSYNSVSENLNTLGFGSSTKNDLSNTSNLLGPTSLNNLALQTSLPQQKNDFITSNNNNKLSTQPDTLPNSYSIQSQSKMFGSSNLNNRIIPSANLAASHTYDKNINSFIANTNQSINNNTLTASQNNNILNTIPQQQSINQSYFGNNYPSSANDQNKNILANVTSPLLNANNSQTNQNAQVNNDSSIRKQSDSLQSYPFSITNSQNQLPSNISSYYNSPNLQYVPSTVRQNDLSNNSILSSMNFAGTTASGLTTSRANYNIPTTSVSAASIVKQNPQTSLIQGTEAEERVKRSSKEMHPSADQQLNMAKRDSEINLQKAMEEIKPSEQVEKILDEIRRKNSSGMNKDGQKATIPSEDSSQKSTPQIQSVQQQQNNKIPTSPHSNLLQSIQNINLDVKGILQNTISKNISTVSNQYQQLLYRGNPSNNNNEYSNNQSQQSAVDKILQEIKRNDMKKHLQSVLTTSTQVNTSNNNIQANLTMSPQLNATNNIYNAIGLKNNYLHPGHQNILDLSNSKINTSPNLTSTVSNPPPMSQQYQLDINKSYSTQTNNQIFSPVLTNQNQIQVKENEDSDEKYKKNVQETRRALENQLDSLRPKQESRKQRLSSFSNSKNQHHLDIPHEMNDSIRDDKDSIGSHESFIEERESIQKFSTNCSQLTTDPLRQTKILILNSIISKDSFKKDDLSASKQPDFSSMSFSQNQAELINQIPSNQNNETRGTYHSAALTPVQQQQEQQDSHLKSSSQPSSKEPTLLSFNQSLNQISKTDNIHNDVKPQSLTQIADNLLSDKMAEKSQTQIQHSHHHGNNKYGEKDFYFVKKLGKGKHSEVFLAQDKKTGFLFAVKQVHKGDMIEMGMEEQFSNEIKIQMCLNHPNIIRLYGYYEDESYFYLLMEYAPGGEIYRYQKTLPEGRFSEAEAAFYLMQLASALRYLHSNNVIHRDLKPENLLISNGVVKLADFGYSRICDFKSTRSTFCGTLDYLSPQVVKGLEYNHDVDVWAFGVMCYEFLQGVAPFYEKTKDDTLDKISTGKYQFVKPISEEAKNFIRILLDTEAKNRITIGNVCRNNWLLQNVEKYQKEQGPISVEELTKIFS